MKDKVDVVINGKVLTLKSNESPEYMQKVALHVDQKILDLKAKNLSSVVDERVRALLIAVNLADDYFKIKDRHTATDVVNKKLTQEVARLEKKSDSFVEQIKTLKNENTTLSDELKKIREKEKTALNSKVQTLKAENTNLNNEVETLKSELAKVTTEFEEFLRNFDNRPADADTSEDIISLPISNTRKAAN